MILFRLMTSGFGAISLCFNNLDGIFITTRLVCFQCVLQHDYELLVNCEFIWPLDTQLSGRFRGPSGRAPFSDEGGFTFSEAPFEGTLHEGLKGASPSEGFKQPSPSEGRAWRGFERGFKGASRGLQRGLKPSEGEGRFERLEGGLKGASRGLHLRKASRGLHLRKASRGLEGGWKPSEGQGGFEGAWRGLEGGFKGACFGTYFTHAQT